jgi:hypothetical protein
MKNRRADKHYEPRHAGTRMDDLRETAGHAAAIVPIATGVMVSLVTGALPALAHHRRAMFSAVRSAP